MDSSGNATFACFSTYIYIYIYITCVRTFIYSYIDLVILCRCIAAHRDPRRISWLFEPLIASLSDETSTSTSQLRVLKLCKALSIEITWRGFTLYKPMVSAIQRHLGGETKALREEAARCLAIISRATMPLNRAPCTPVDSAQMPKASVLVDSCIPQLAGQLLQTYTTSVNI